MTIDYKQLLIDLVEAIVDGCDIGKEIDAGYDGEGPLAHAMVATGYSSTLEEATNIIYPDNDDDVEEM